MTATLPHGCVVYVHVSPLQHRDICHRGRRRRPINAGYIGKMGPPELIFDDSDPDVAFYASRPQLIGIVLAIAGNLVISFALALTKVGGCRMNNFYPLLLL